jgi:hypothetical protein
MAYIDVLFVSLSPKKDKGVVNTRIPSSSEARARSELGSDKREKDWKVEGDTLLRLSITTTLIVVIWIYFLLMS